MAEDNLVGVGALVKELSTKYQEFDAADEKLKEIGRLLQSVGSDLTGNLIGFRTPSYPTADEVRNLVEDFLSAGEEVNRLRRELVEKTGLAFVTSRGSRLTTEN